MSILKKKFSDYTAEANGCRSVAEAADELRRELEIRRRCFDRWVSEGRLSLTDAHDRLERLLTAVKLFSDSAFCDASQNVLDSTVPVQS